MRKSFMSYAIHTIGFLNFHSVLISVSKLSVHLSVSVSICIILHTISICTQTNNYFHYKDFHIHSLRYIH